VASTLSPTTVATLVTRSIILDATRCWRSARDSRTPVQPALYQALDVHRCAVLTPVLDSLLKLYETCIGRRFRAGAYGQAAMSGDEHDLLDLLAGADGGEAVLIGAGAKPGLAGAMRVALRSARIMLRLALDPADQAPSLPVMRLMATA
jgi:hypothetical protein